MIALRAFAYALLVLAASIYLFGWVPVLVVWLISMVLLLALAIAAKRPEESRMHHEAHEAARSEEIADDRAS